MNALCKAVYSLQAALPPFLYTLQEKRPLTQSEQRAMQLFLERLLEMQQQVASSPLAPKLSSIQKHWRYVCRELVQDGKSSIKEIFEPIDKIYLKLNNLIPDSCDLVADFNAEYKPIKTVEALTLQQAAPRAYENAATLVKRIMSGVYGYTLRQKHLDAHKCPLLLKEHFIRMLYIDLHLRHINPQEGCEYFRREPFDHHLSVRSGLQALQNELQTQMGMSESDIGATLLDKATRLQNEEEAKFSQILKMAEFSQIRHSHLLEHVRAYFWPTEEEMLFVATRQAFRCEFEAAMQLAMRLADDAMINVILTIASIDDLAAIHLLARVIRIRPESCVKCARAIFNNWIKQSKTQDLSHFRALLGCVSESVDRLNLLESFFKYKLRHADNLQMSFQQSLQLCKSLLSQSDYALEHASLVFVALATLLPQDDLTPLDELLSEMDDSELRLYLLNRLISYSHSDEGSFKLQDLQALQLEPKERLHVVKARVIQATKQNRLQEALQFIKNATQDEMTKVLLERLMTNVRPYIKVNLRRALDSFPLI